VDFLGIGAREKKQGGREKPLKKRPENDSTSLQSLASARKVGGKEDCTKGGGEKPSEFLRTGPRQVYEEARNETERS